MDGVLGRRPRDALQHVGLPQGTRAHFASTLGMSNQVLRLIETRQFWDKVLVYGGMLLTLALLYFVFFRLRRTES